MAVIIAHPSEKDNEPFCVILSGKFFLFFAFPPVDAPAESRYNVDNVRRFGKGGRAVKRILHVGLLLLAVWLLVLGSSALVEGPEEGAKASPAPLPPMAAQVALTSPEGNARVDHPCETETMRAKTSLPAPEKQQEGGDTAGSVRAADQNGHPVLSRTYIRTVYQAFPPERMAG